MKEMFIEDTEVLDALEACLSAYDRAALRAMKETFNNDADELAAVVACLSEYDLSGLRAVYGSRLAEAKQERKQSHLLGHDERLIQALDAICNALKTAQDRRQVDAGSYEW